MGFKCINGHEYYYECYRDDRGRVRTRYVGGGELGFLAALLDGYARADRAEALAAERVRLAELAESDAPLDRYCRGVEQAFRAGMEARGYSRGARHGWRKSRMSPRTPATTPPQPLPRGPDLAALNAAVRKAWDGDDDGARELQALLKTDWRPTLLEWIGDPEAYAVTALAGLLGGEDNLATKECVEERLKELRRDLTPPDASPLERLLAGRVAVCWLAVNACERSSAARRKGVTPRERDALDRRVDRAHRRFLSAVRALADFRKTDPAAVQVLVQQVQQVVPPPPSLPGP